MLEGKSFFILLYVLTTGGHAYVTRSSTYMYASIEKMQRGHRSCMVYSVWFTGVINCITQHKRKSLLKINSQFPNKESTICF